MRGVLAYLRERMPLARFGPVAVLLGLLGQPPPGQRLASVGLAWIMVASFRLRDDLADRERDAVEHGERVLVRAASIRPFVRAWLAGLATATIGLTLMHGWARALGLLSLALAFELGYRAELPARHRWVLLKYPLFAALLATTLAPTLAGLCYLGFVLYERIDDPALRRRPDAGIRLGFYLLAAAALAWIHVQTGAPRTPYGPVAQALWLAIPVTFAGLTHVFAIHRELWPRLAAVRLDGGCELRGRPLFGANKTLRGAIVMIAACVIWTLITDSLQSGLGLDESLRFIPRTQLDSLGLGLVLGVAYVLGELPNSLIKRQLDIAPGGAARGWARPVFWVVDQLDSAVAIILALSLFRVPSATFVITLVALTLTVHPSVAALMVALGLKRRIA